MVDTPKELTQDQIDGFLHDMRNIGLYENRVRRLSAKDESGGDDFFDTLIQPKESVREVLILDFFVGEVAFLPRVQAPEQAAYDEQFGALARQLGAEEFEATQHEIADKLAQGLNPFDMEEDHDGAFE